MESAAGGYVEGVENPRYHQGVAYMQAGRWEEAIHCFQGLVEQYPENHLFQQTLEQARFKASLDAKNQVKPKRWIIQWRPLLFRLLVILFLFTLAVQGGSYLSNRIAPLIEQARLERHRAQLLADGRAFLKAGDLDSAEARFGALLADLPGHVEAKEGLEQARHLRMLDRLYRGALSLQQQGKYEEAIADFTDLSVIAPNYRDVSQRLTSIRRQQELDQLFTQGEATYKAGDLVESVTNFEQVRELDAGYRTDRVTERLLALYIALGRTITEADPPRVDELPQALEYFGRALTLSPRNGEAALEQQLGKRYLDGLALYHAGRWNGAINELKSVYDRRPTYLGGVLPEMLYDLYVKSGDEYRAAGDLYRAFEQYRLAAALPVADPALALGRAKEVQPFLTPTPTPTITPTPRPVVAESRSYNYPPVYPPMREPSGGQATPVPSATPTPVQLASLHNRVVFISDHPQQPGLWSMEATGADRRYLGDSPELRSQHAALVEAAQFSPDRRYQLYVGTLGETTQIFMTMPAGSQEPVQLTNLGQLSYHPVWSPSGSYILFVSQDSGSDDIWIMNANGSEARNLTPNQHFDKHPTWSPNGTQMLFWSNRNGVKQLYMMDTDGRNVRNVSNTGWDEYDPIWIR